MPLKNFKVHKKNWLFLGGVKNQPVLPHRMLTLFFFTFPTGYKTLRQRERIIMSGRK